MPQVKMYGREQVEKRPLPNIRTGVRAPVEAFGGGRARAQVFEAASGIAREVADLALQEKRKTDQIMFQDLDSQLSNAQLEIQQTVASRRGKNAATSVDEAKKLWEERSQAVLANAKNREQQQSVQGSMINRWDALNRFVQIHVDTELKAHDQESTTLYIDNARNEAFTNYNNPEAVQLSIDRQKASLKDFAKRNDRSPEWLAAQLQDSESKTHFSVLSRMLSNGEDLAAKQYFDENKSKLVGKDLLEIEKDLKVGTVRGEGRRLSDELLKKHSTMTAALEDAKSIKDTDVYDETVRRVRATFEIRREADRERQEQIFNAAANLIEKNKTRDSVSPRLWNALSLEHRNALDSRLKQLNQGIEPATDWTLYNDLVTLASTPETKDSFLKQNLGVHRAKLADAEFKEIVKLQADLRKGDQKASDQLLGIRSRQEIINRTLGDAGVDLRSEEGTDEYKQISLFRRRVEEQAYLQELQTGKKVNNLELQGIADNLMREVITSKGFFFDTKKPVFEAIAETVNDVPREERVKIQDALRRNNRPVTNGEVIRLYNQKILRGKSANQ